MDAEGYSHYHLGVYPFLLPFAQLFLVLALVFFLSMAIFRKTRSLANGGTRTGNVGAFHVAVRRGDGLRFLRGSGGGVELPAVAFTGGRRHSRSAVGVQGRRRGRERQ